MHTNHKIIITGTGRTGTTFLVRLLTALRQPTGYNSRTWRNDYFPHCSAGLEQKVTDPNAPYIVKDPDLCVTLAAALASGGLVIDHAIVPIRELDHAALSRIRVGGNNGEVPGGLIGTDSPDRQRSVLAERFHQLVHTLVAHDIRHTFLLFPRFVQDPVYAFAKLHPIFPAIERAEFETVFRATADPTLVHDFGPGNAVAAADTHGFQARERRKRRLRRVRRIAGWSAVATSLILGWQLSWMAPAASRGAAQHAVRAPAPAVVHTTAAHRPSLRTPPPGPSMILAVLPDTEYLASTIGDFVPATLRLYESVVPPAMTFTSPAGAPEPPLAVPTPAVIDRR